MGDKTGIQWTDATWNPIVGCSIVSPACTNCYAMAQAARIQRMAAGAGKETHYDLTTKEVNGKPVWTGVLKLAPEHILILPLRWKKPRRIFVNSMSDLFHESVPDKQIDLVFAIMALAPQHTFQVLTKRPKRMREYFEGNADQTRRSMVNNTCFGFSQSQGARFTDEQCRIRRWPLQNVWLGITAEDQPRADERREDFKATPAAVKFVSYEPALGPVDWRGWEFVNQIIFGGESGSSARPPHPQWARITRDFCAPRGIAFYLKQWGEWKPVCEMGEDEINDAYYPAPENFPEARRRPRFAQCVLHDDAERFDDVAARGAFSAGKNGMLMFRTGKSRAGRLLDGREHDAFPEVRP